MIAINVIAVLMCSMVMGMSLNENPINWYKVSFFALLSVLNAGIAIINGIV